jgi:aminoglycoside phosphotransferase family enzyme/predicted kinase
MGVRPAGWQDDGMTETPQSQDNVRDSAQDNAQDDVLAFLADPATHCGTPARRIDTHAAAVFLAGERALKIKRAVKFPFLDFSTRERRKAALEAELDVNRRFAPELYRRVVAITRRPDGGLALDGTGPAVEWALEMRRFDESATFDHLAERGCIDLALADALGRVIAQAHARAPRAEPAPWLAALADYIAQNEDAFGAMPDLFAPEAAARLTQASRARLAQITPLMAARGKAGLIRRIHGDLHLGNIVLIGGKPVLFDAIEFSAIVGSGDLLYDLAFVLMDLVGRGLPAQANALFNRYLTETDRDGDLDALSALPLFLSLRAAIRAKVTAARLATSASETAGDIRSAARAYFALACATIAPEPPRLIAIGGLSGTGKSVLARALAPTIGAAPGAVVLRSDVMRKRLFGCAETQKLPQDAYTQETTQRLYRLLNDKALRVAAAGHSAVIDAVFARQDERDAAHAAARASGVPFAGAFLTAVLATRMARVGARANDASDADAAVAQRQESYDLGSLDWARIDASGTPEETLAQARRTLAHKP